MSVDTDRALPVASAHLQQKHVRLRSVLLILFVAGVHQKLVAGEALRPMTLLAGFTRRAQVLYRRRNRTRISMESYGDDLAQAGEFRPDKTTCSRADVTLDASYPRVRRILVGGVLGVHHGVAGFAAEVRRIHILNPAVRGGTENQDIQQRRHGNVLQRAPYHGQAQIDGREDLRQRPASAQTSAPEPNTNWNQEQAEYKNAGKDQIDEKTNIRVRRSGQENVIKPERQYGERCTGRDHSPGERNGVLPQVVDRLRPVSDSLSQTHL